MEIEGDFYCCCLLVPRTIFTIRSCVSASNSFFLQIQVLLACSILVLLLSMAFFGHLYLRHTPTSPQWASFPNEPKAENCIRDLSDIHQSKKLRFN